MKVAFFSCYLSIHQLPLCLALNELCGREFTYVSTEPISQKRIDFGYKDLDCKYPFVIRTYDNPENESIAMKIAMESDIVIIGSAPNKFVKERIRKNKIVFRYSERIYRTNKMLLQLPLRFIKYKHENGFGKNVYLLCASAYAAADYARTGMFRNKSYKWGYFPEVKQQNLEELFLNKRQKSKVSLLWVGRLLALKHPEAAISAAEKLVEEGYDFELNIIGNGVLENQIKNMISEKNLQKYVHMLGAMPSDKVRNYMDKADIFLFTSDFYEGWGAVLNEAMNSGCAVVASHAIGSVPFLVENGKNGYIYINGNQDDLNKKVIWLIEHPQERRKMGIEAYKTLENEWNANNAAKKLINLAKKINEGQRNVYDEGVCSKAQNLKNSWFK